MRPILTLWMLFGSAAPLPAQHVYEELGGERGLGPYLMADGLSGGIAAADYDGDGDVDLFVPTALDTPDLLYRNRGDGSFDEVAAVAGLASLGNHRAGLWLDVDGDHDLDLVVAGDANGELESDGESTLRLYRQEADGSFTDVTDASGLAGDHNFLEDTHVGGLVAGDVDGDCDLDLYLALWEGENFLFENDGHGHFQDVTVAAGLRSVGSRWQPVLFDVEGDGDLDLFQAVDFLVNELWINQGDGTFVDLAAAAGVDSNWNEMGVALGDYDADGDFDIYVTNLFLHGRHNRLYRNDSTVGAASFTDVSLPAGVFNGGCGWGATFVDGDHSGHLDIATTNGGGGACAMDRSRYFESDGAAEPFFTEVGATVGYWDSQYGSGLVAVDADRDGDQDLIQACNWGGPLLLYDCLLTGAAASQGHLVVRPRMRGPNTHAIGAVVRVTAGGHTMIRLVTAGTSSLSQEPAEAHFGLGAATSGELSIQWPGGRVTHYGTVEANRTLTLLPDRESLCAPGTGATPMAPAADRGPPSTASLPTGQAGG